MTVPTGVNLPTGGTERAGVTGPSATGTTAPPRDEPGGPAGSEPAVAGDVAALSARFTRWAADDLVGYCPIYEQIAHGMVGDPESLALLLGPAPIGRTPVLALAAVHDLVLGHPDSPLAAIYAGRSAIDPWPPFRDLLHQRHDAVVERMRTRSIQTNEVGRSAALLPALAAVARQAASAGDERPLAVVEIGPSAGLNLMFDRYGATYRRESRVVGHLGDPDSPVQLDCELRGSGTPGALLAPRVPLAIATRIGLDLSPVDVTDPDACRWLSACVWPGIPDRPQRLEAALALARPDPPDLRTGDAVSELAPLLANLPDTVLPVVISTWALAYVRRQGRADLLGALDELALRRDLLLLTAEEPGATPWVPPARAELTAELEAGGDGRGTTTVLAVRRWRDGEPRTEVLALCHPHVRWMAWNDQVGGTP